MSARRNFRKFLQGLYDSKELQTITEQVWKDMNVTMPMWPGHEGECQVTVRIAVKHFGPLLPAVRCMRIRFLQRFSTGDPAHHAESDCFDEYLLEKVAEAGFPKEKTFDEQLRGVLEQELRDLKDFFISDVNKERIHVN